MITFKDFIRKVKWWDEIDNIYQWYLTNAIHEIINSVNINKTDDEYKEVDEIVMEIKNNLINWVNE